MALAEWITLAVVGLIFVPVGCLVAAVLVQLGSPANVPKRCGRSPGRPKGKRSPPATRLPAVKLAP